MLFRPKVASKDFDENCLPQSRKEIFFDVLRLQWPKLLMLGVLSMLVSLPLLATAIMRSSVQTNGYAAATTGAIKQEAAIMQITVMTTMLNGIDILLFAILGIGLSSAAHCIKRLAWEENVELSKAIPDGLRQNWKQYGLLGLLVGVGVFIAKYAATAAQDLSGYLPAVILAVVFAPIAAYMSVTITVYDIPFTEQFRYSLLSYAKNVPQTLAAACLCFLPFAGALAAGMLLGTAFGAITATIMRLFIPVIMLAWFLFAYTSLDRSINEKYYPELVRRGLDLTHYEEEVNWLDF